MYLMRGSLYSSAADVYALGLMTIELFTGMDMFHQQKHENTLRGYIHNKQAVLHNIKTAIRQIVQDCNVPDAIEGLSMECLEEKADDRITIGKWNETWRRIQQGSTM